MTDKVDAVVAALDEMLVGDGVKRKKDSPTRPRAKKPRRIRRTTR